jgi:hypothetical protein
MLEFNLQWTLKSIRELAVIKALDFRKSIDIPLKYFAYISEHLLLLSFQLTNTLTKLGFL